MTTLAADPTEVLENGARRSTPGGDNLVLDHIRAEADAYTALAEAAGGRVYDVPELQLRAVDLAILTPFGAAAFLDGPVPPGRTDDVVDCLRAFFSVDSGGPFILYAPWATEDLTGHGFAHIGHPPLMFRPAGGNAPLAPGLRIQAVRDEQQLADFERTLIEAYPAPELQPWTRGVFFGPEVLDTSWRLFVGYADGEPVATAAAYVSPHVTMIELVSTRPEVRGRGFGAALTAAATLVEPEQPAMLISSDLGRPVYDRLGYLPLTRYTLWLGTR